MSFLSLYKQSTCVAWTCYKGDDPARMNLMVRVGGKYTPGRKNGARKREFYIGGGVRLRVRSLNSPLPPGCAAIAPSMKHSEKTTQHTSREAPQSDKETDERKRPRHG